MSLCSAFSPTKETSHCFRRVPTLFLFVWPWKARSVLQLALLSLSARSCREAAAGRAAFCRGSNGKKDSASEIPLVLLSLPPSQHKGGFVCAQEPTKKFGREMSSPLEKGEGVEHVAASDTNLYPLPPPGHGLEMAIALAGCCVTSHSCRAAHETAVAGLYPWRSNLVSWNILILWCN